MAGKKLKAGTVKGKSNFTIKGLHSLKTGVYILAINDVAQRDLYNKFVVE